MIRVVAQLGRALGSGPRGRWFKSSQPDHFSPNFLTFNILMLFRKIQILCRNQMRRLISYRSLIVLNFTSISYEQNECYERLSLAKHK